MRMTEKRRKVLEAIRDISAENTISGSASHREIGRRLGVRPDLAHRICRAMSGAFTEHVVSGAGMVQFWRITPAGLAALEEGEG